MLPLAVIVAVAVLAAAVARSRQGPMPAPPALGSCRQLCRAPSSVEPSACTADAGSRWVTYGADARRDFAVAGCATGLRARWRYVPVPASGRSLRFVYHAEADAGHVYIEYAGADNQYPATTAVDAVDPTSGLHQWTFDSNTDVSVGTWATMAMKKLIQVDDGRYIIDPATGHAEFNGWTDLWSDGIAVDGGTAIYISGNGARIDADNLSLRAYAMPTRFPWAHDEFLWQQNVFDSRHCKGDSADAVDGLAVDAGVVFYAARYTGHATTPSGIYAFDVATGSQRWFVATDPQSRVSADAGRVYLVENGALTARRQADGTPAWSVAVSGAGAQSPVLANGLVIVASASGIDAYRAMSGALVWHAPITGAASPLATRALPAQCPPTTTAMQAGQSDGNTAGKSTTMAAALGSETLVVTAADGLHVLRLGDGSERWRGVPDQARGRLHDPVIVGATVYVMDSDGVLALTS